uniref:Uncharacterized protein n=1 Tax=Nelumbo nucifera TaxID=4432 RepID=A0A822Z380_NELNU|nr:TPA_asm: hypothetical protein HUJ06_008548 [Nelumbo nucifera]DAD37909.1 TPA_asm: hypothetical protein HUJ06_008550 [Nelumbo nucifera]
MVGAAGLKFSPSQTDISTSQMKNKPFTN